MSEPATAAPGQPSDDPVASAEQPLPPGDRCLACGAPLHSMGIERLRVGGTSGGWKMMFGEWAELGEDVLPLEMLACARCRRVELRVPGDEAAVPSSTEPVASAVEPDTGTAYGAAGAPSVTPPIGDGSDEASQATHDGPIATSDAASPDAGYSPGMKVGATLLTIFAPFIALIAALLMLGSERGPVKRAFLRTWAWISTGVLALGIFIAIGVLTSVAGSTHNVDQGGECIGGPVIGAPGVEVAPGRFRFPCVDGGSTVVDFGTSEPPAP